MPELKVIVMPPQRGVKRPKRSWRNPGRDTVAERVARDRKYTIAADCVMGGIQIVALSAAGLGLWVSVCLVAEVRAWGI